MPAMRTQWSLLAALVLLSAGKDVAAVDYGAAISIDANAVHHDNYRLTEQDKIEIHGLETSPRLRLNADTETRRLNFDTTLRSSRYNNADYNSDDQFYTAGYRQMFERSSIGLNANVAHDSTSTSETATSGRIGNRSERHERYALSPSWQYGLSERNSLDVGGTYSKDLYEGRNYVGYEFWQVTTNWNHVYSERLIFLLQAGYSDYRSEDRSLQVLYFDDAEFQIPMGIARQGTATEQHSVALLAGFKYQWNEQQSLQMLIGRYDQETDYVLDDPARICDRYTSALCQHDDQSGDGLSADIDWRWNNEHHQIGLTLKQSTQPSSDGQALEQLQLAANWGVVLSELQYIRLSLQGYRNRDLNDGSQTAYQDRDYASAALAYSYKLSETWQLTTQYLHRYQEYTETHYRASGQIVTIGIQYKPNDWHWSR